MTPTSNHETRTSEKAKFYCATHRGEDRAALTGEPLDACTEHMVKHRSYDLASLMESVRGTKQVIWRMAQDPEDGFYRFAEVVFEN